MVKNTEKISPYKNRIFSSALYISESNRKGTEWLATQHEDSTWYFTIIKAFFVKETQQNRNNSYFMVVQVLQ